MLFEFETFVLNLFCLGFVYVEEDLNVKLVGADCVKSQRRLNEELESIDRDDWLRFVAGLRGLTPRHRLTEEQYQKVSYKFLFFFQFLFLTNPKTVTGLHCLYLHNLVGLTKHFIY